MKEKMITFSELTQQDKDALSFLFFIKYVRKVKIKKGLKSLLEKLYNESYESEKDKQFFGKYEGKEVLVFLDNRLNDEWCIVSDNNYILSKDCFEEENK